MKRSIVILFVLALPLALAAHPHVFIDANINFIFAGSRATHAELNWVFDAMFTEQVLSQCDGNRNRLIDAAEIPAVRQGFFVNLRHSKYFVFLWINDVFQQTVTATDFHASVNPAGRLVFRFRIPLAVPAAGPVRVKLMNSDPTIFVAFMTRPGSSRALGAAVPAKVVNNDQGQFQLTYGG